MEARIAFKLNAVKKPLILCIATIGLTQDLEEL